MEDTPALDLLATDIGVAAHFVDGVLHRVVSSRPKKKAYRVALHADGIEEAIIEPDYL